MKGNKHKKTVIKIIIRMNRINWNHLIELNIQDKIINNIKSYFHKRIDDKKLIWLNTVFNDIFIYQIFVDEINKSGYLTLDMENKRVIRKELNVDAPEFIPHSAINIANAEFIPQSDNMEFISQNYNMELLVNSMLRDLIN